MSKISVFKFNINSNDPQTINTINQLVSNYLTTHGFYYNNEKLCYTTGTPSAKKTATAIASVGATAVTTALVGGSVVSVNALQRGFEYQISGNQLIIKAYVFTKNGKTIIHPSLNTSNAGAAYYGDMKFKLFEELKKYNIVLASQETETIKDGSEAKTAKMLLIVFGIMIAVVALLFILLLR